MVSPGFCLVTPASRGLGFALSLHLLKHTNLPIVTTARRDCTNVYERLLDEVGARDAEAATRLMVLPVDVTGVLPSFHFWLYTWAMNGD